VYLFCLINCLYGDLAFTISCLINSEWSCLKLLVKLLLNVRFDLLHSSSYQIFLFLTASLSLFFLTFFLNNGLQTLHYIIYTFMSLVIRYNWFWKCSLPMLF